MKRLALTFLIVGILLLGACGESAIPTTPVSEPAIPAHFTTYTDKAGLFSISYPPDWELPPPEEISVLEQSIKEIITSIESGVFVERVRAIFVAGLPIEMGYMPSVNIVVEPLPGGWTQEKLVEEQVENIKRYVPDYHELSHVKTIVGGRQATIVEYEGTFPTFDKKYTYLQMFIAAFVSKTAWTVTCTASPDEYYKWEADFNAIVRSLRILK